MSVRLSVQRILESFPVLEAHKQRNLVESFTFRFLCALDVKGKFVEGANLLRYASNLVFHGVKQFL